MADIEIEETPEMIERACTAYHEAGHAVVAYHLGMLVERVCIAPDGIALGDTFVSHLGHKVRPRMAMIMAGGLAELFGAEHRGWPHGREKMSRGAGQDQNQLSDLLKRLKPESHGAAFAEAREQATDILTTHWETVEALMLALYERETLSRMDVLCILNPPPPLPSLPDA